MKQDLLFIGIGFSGCKILSKTNDNIAKLFIDTDSKVFEKYAGLRIGAVCCGKYSAGGDIELGQAAIEGERKANLSNHTLKALQKLCPVKVLENIDYKQLINVTYDDVLNLQNEIYIKTIETLIN